MNEQSFALRYFLKNIRWSRKIVFLATSKIWVFFSSECLLIFCKLCFQIKTGSHSPGMYRIIGPLQNSPDFARDFGCSAGSGMNPKDKCAVWWSCARESKIKRCQYAIIWVLLMVECNGILDEVFCVCVQINCNFWGVHFLFVIQFNAFIGNIGQAKKSRSHHNQIQMIPTKVDW